ncbi:cadmium-induced protein AS8-like isoform X2 [Andrographis paniculata]|nr:cadmium-induced protein AS8-like isoform X2 [Andrographis paniculata]XP_051129223.1 cadmium-induced protein AS8-like isoform X2 [Andrographis paniculata]
MIIKTIFRRYERWNPVHPTYGAFWGMGLGIGCGIGWGPGFGPEVISYVGAGCGVGFSVGITFLGVGIGLPCNYLWQVPHNALTKTSRGVLDIARAKDMIGKGSLVEDHWADLRTHFPDVVRNPSASFSGFNIDNITGNLIDCSGTKRMLADNAKHIADRLHRVSRRCFPWGDKGSN